MTTSTHLLLVPAYGFSARFWDPLRSLGIGVEHSVQVLTGFSSSDPVRPSFERHVQDVVDETAAIRGDVVLVGHCASAKVVLAAARRVVVRGVVLVCPNLAPLGSHESVAARRGSEMQRVSERVARSPRLADLLARMEQQTSEERRGGGPLSVLIDPDLESLLVAGERDGDSIRRYYGALHEFYRVRTEPLLPEPGLPVSVVLAERDEYVDAGPVEELRARAAVNVVTIDGADHFFPYRQPARLAQALADHVVRATIS